jgi:deoxyribodipyrimidine photo-lyase
MKFGAVSCREVLAAFDRVPSLVAELMWREFFAHLAAGCPGVLAGQLDPARGHRLNRHHLAHRDKALDSWTHDAAARKALAAWESGSTGVPIVDAAMRELRDTGRLHNRLRMVVASHLVRAMGVDWRLGERAFARMLEDYDPASNGGGWRAMDAQAPGREIRADSQARRFDPSGAYVKAWAPPASRGRRRPRDRSGV